MKYFKNTELAKLYHVSEKSVRNWIAAAQERKLALELYEEGGKAHIANTTKNIVIIEKLVDKGKKYKNSRGKQIVTPTKKFYETYNQRQILQIISNMVVHKEIPLQYGYLDGGAEGWAEYTARLDDEPLPNILMRTRELLDTMVSNIDHFVEPSKKINIIDLGPGNGLPIKGMLEKLIAADRLNRYVAIDISPEMLQIVERNMREWFGDKIRCELVVRDFSSERFDDTTLDGYIDNTGGGEVNLVCLLGGTLCNFRSSSQVLQTINASLGIDDLLIYSGYLDTPHTRRYFDFNAPGEARRLPANQKVVPDLLGIDEDSYEVMSSFSEERSCRFTTVRPKMDLLINFSLANGAPQIELRKNDSILTWRHLHYGAVELINLFDENDFELLQATKSKEREYILLIAKVKTPHDTSSI